MANVSAPIISRGKLIVLVVLCGVAIAAAAVLIGLLGRVNIAQSINQGKKNGARATASSGTLRGVNLASAEFNESVLPGTYGTDYLYPTDAEVDYFVGNGMNVLRLPFLWERLQPELNGDLDPAELSRIDAFVNYATEKGAYIVLDVHNYNQYRGKEIGTTAVPAKAFTDLWSRLATHYQDNDHVMFGLMNEPGLGMAKKTTSAWRNIVQKTVTAIRETGAANTILYMGSVQDAANWMSWVDASDNKTNAQIFAEHPIIDPLHESFIEVHQYFDADGSGTSPTCIDFDSDFSPWIARDPYDLAAWLRKTGNKMFLGEFGVAANSECLADLDKMLTYMHDNSDVWLGWTYWAAGPMWGDYMFSVEPDASGHNNQQWSELEKHL